MIFAWLFQACFLIDFSCDFSWILGTLYPQNHMFYYRKTTISIKSQFRFFTDFSSIFGSIFGVFSLIFSTFSVSNFRWFFDVVFLRFLDQKWTKMAPKLRRAVTLLAPKIDLGAQGDFWMHLGRLLAPFWHPLGSILVVLGSILLPFGSILLPFRSSGSLLAPFSLHFRSFS